MPANSADQEALRNATQYFPVHDAGLADEQNQAIVWVGQQMRAQVAFLAHMDVF